MRQMICAGLLIAQCALFAQAENNLWQTLTQNQAPAPQTPPPSEQPPSITIDKITIEGINNKEQLQNAIQYLSIENLKGEESSRIAYIDYLIEKGKEEIKTSQQPFGYYLSEVSVERKQNKDGTIEIIYHVTLNQATTLSIIDIEIIGEGKGDPAFKRLLENHPFKKGNTLNHQEYENYKAQFLSQSTSYGYFNAHFLEHSIRISEDRKHAEIFLHFDTGNRFIFQNVAFIKGEDAPEIPLQESLLQRFVKFKNGQHYSAQDIEELQQDLQASGYFRQVLVTPKPDHNAEKVPVETQLYMNRNRHYLFGLGYSTNSGFRGRFDFNRRWVNSRGHSFNSSFYISQRNSVWDNIYRIPAQNPSTDYYYLRLGGWVERDNYDSRRVFLEGGYNWVKNHWEYRIAGIAAYDKFAIGNDSGEVVLLYPQLQATYSSTQEKLNPESGFQARITALGGSDKLATDVSFAQTNLNLRYIQSLNPKNRLIFRLDTGALWTDNFHQLPPSLRYFAGGDRSVRGYGYERIGEYDSSNTNIGGKYLAVGSAEYEYYFKGNWALASFIDVGDAFKNDFKAYIGAGVGVHWRSPVGPIRLDVAHGFDKERGDNIRFHLSIGADLDL